VTTPDSLSDHHPELPDHYRVLFTAEEPGVTALALLSVTQEGFVRTITVKREESLMDSDLAMVRALLIHCTAKFADLPEVRALLEKADRCCQRAQGVVDGVDHLSTTLN
jgi:hypothetical protein